MDWKNFRIVWRDSNVYHLLIKESLVIRAYEPRLNRTTHSVPLLVFPEGLERHLFPDPNGWPFSLSIEEKKKTDDDPNNKRTSVLHSFMSSPSSRTRRLFVTIGSRTAPLIEHLSPLFFFWSNVNVHVLPRALLRVCLRVCVCPFLRSPSLDHHRSFSLCFSLLGVTSLAVLVVWALVFSSLVLIVFLENGCIDTLTLTLTHPSSRVNNFRWPLPMESQSAVMIWFWRNYLFVSRSFRRYSIIIPIEEDVASTKILSFFPRCSYRPPMIFWNKKWLSWTDVFSLDRLSDIQSPFCIESEWMKLIFSPRNSIFLFRSFYRFSTNIANDKRINRTSLFFD